MKEDMTEAEFKKQSIRVSVFGARRAGIDQEA
jgi:hypothetical protein